MPANRYIFKQGLYNQALPILQAAKGMLGSAVALDRLVAADVFSATASILLEQAKAVKAHDYYARAVSIHERLLPANHIHLANLYINLANSLNALNRYGESLSLHLKAVQMRERCPHLARSMFGLSYGNLERLFTRMNRLDEAATVLQKSIEIRRGTMGAKSSKLAK